MSQSHFWFGQQKTELGNCRVVERKKKTPQQFYVLYKFFILNFALVMHRIFSSVL